MSSSTADCSRLVTGSRLKKDISSNVVASSHPEHYLEDVIGRVDTTPVSQIAKLTPWAWADERAKAAAD